MSCFVSKLLKKMFIMHVANLGNEKISTKKLKRCNHNNLGRNYNSIYWI